MARLKNRNRTPHWRSILIPGRANAVNLLIFIVIGLLAGVGAIAFQLLCDVGVHVFLDALAGYRPSGPAGEPHLFSPTTTVFNRWVLLFLPAAGGLVSGWLVYTLAPEAKGHGTDAAIDAYHNQGGFIRARIPFIKTIASAITLSTGGSGGREGPITQIGGGIGSLIATRLNLSERRRRIMLAAGVAGGLGSIFRTPLAGALFASEVLYREPEIEGDVLIPAGIASVVAYCLFCLVFGWGSLFASLPYKFTNPMELGPYIILAGILSGAGFVFVKCFYGLEQLFTGLPVPDYLKPALGGLCTGIIGFFLPETLGFGYGFLQQALLNEVGLTILLAVAFGKILTTSFTIGSGGSGGLFGPSVVIGGTLGGAVGLAFQTIAPDLIQAPEAMVLLGMAGFFTSVSNAPISAIIFVAEMTNSYQMLLPSLLVCVLCYQLSRKWTLFDRQVANKAASPAHAGEFFVDVLQNSKVSDIKDHIRTVTTVPEYMSLAEFKLFFTSTNQQYFPVMDDQDRMIGIFSNTDIRRILFDTDMDQLVVVSDIATTDIIRTTLEEDLNEVMKKFTFKNIEAIPVVTAGAPGRLLGMLHRKEVIAFYNNKIEEMRLKARR